MAVFSKSQCSFLFFFSDVRGAFEVRAAVCPHEPPSTRHPTVLLVKFISNKHQQLVIKQYIYVLHSSSHFSAANGCVKQIYDALSLSAFPLFHGSVASHCRRGEVFSRCSLVAALPSQQHFHSYTGRSFSAPFFFQNNSLSSSSGNGFAWTRTNYLK